ncbi:hypothetical protein [Tautonia plasticadhaerens]|uniref:Uncharacterized protein n=1 Tax=Tautonia plasticadhaerens TaxID=2527974 RepID=A0A518HDS8_9BACT|nr:hypothetical protein [Tautonia plasticadhaerens]QDV39009.1 hypothetical protein ElP_69700 [Tautonia plasticadhaerens]
MTWLSEDPWTLVGACGVLALASLVLLRITQQGKYLAWAGGAAAAAALVLLVELLWVTDRERIERVIYDMADAVEHGEFPRVESHLAPEFERESGAFSKFAIRGAVMGLDFEFIRVSRLEVHAGERTGMGKADFLGMAQWAVRSPEGGATFDATPPPGVGFSFGFREVEPTQWKVSRIEVTSVPMGGTPEAVSGYLSRFAPRASRSR